MDELDVTLFASEWLTGLEHSSASARSLLGHVDEWYEYGAYFMMANIGPRAGDVDASDDVLVLYAVLATFQIHRSPGRDVWDGAVSHLNAAFAFANELSRRGVALTLLRDLAERSRREEPEGMREIRARSIKQDPERLAEHDREMAGILLRSVRAATVVDPSVSFDDVMLEEL